MNRKGIICGTLCTLFSFTIQFGSWVQEKKRSDSDRYTKTCRNPSVYWSHSSIHVAFPNFQEFQFDEQIHRACCFTLTQATDQPSMFSSFVLVIIVATFPLKGWISTVRWGEEMFDEVRCWGQGAETKACLNLTESDGKTCGFLFYQLINGKKTCGYPWKTMIFVLTNIYQVYIIFFGGGVPIMRDLPLLHLKSMGFQYEPLRCFRASRCCQSWLFITTMVGSDLPLLRHADCEGRFCGGGWSCCQYFWGSTLEMM